MIFIEIMITCVTCLQLLTNCRFYLQVDGVTMGSPLGPTISNLCLAHLENELLSAFQI